jgi:outer membrane autotransporter protein
MDKLVQTRCGGGSDVELHRDRRQRMSHSTTAQSVSHPQLGYGASHEGRCRTTRIACLLLLASTIILGVGLSGEPALAQESWNGGAGNWAPATNWTPNTVPNAVGATATFNDTSGSVFAVSIAGGPFTIGTLNLNGPQDAGGFSLSGGTLIMQSGVGSAQINVQTNASVADVNGATLQLNSDTNINTIAGAIFKTSASAAITGTGALIKSGAGIATLGGSAIYSGPTLVNGGTLRASGANVFSGASAHSVATGGFLDLNNFDQTIASLSGSGNVGLGSATLTVGGDNSSTTFSGSISSTGGIVRTGGIVKIGTGTLILSGANTYVGGTLAGGGTLALAHVTQGIFDAAGFGSIGLGGATLRTFGSGDLDNGITSNPNTANSIIAATGTTVTIGVPPCSGTCSVGGLLIHFSGLGLTLGAGSVTTFGSGSPGDAGTIVLPRASTGSSTARVVIAGGTVAIQGSFDNTANVILGSIRSTTVNVGATLEFNSFPGASVNNLNGSGNVAVSVGCTCLGSGLSINNGDPDGGAFVVNQFSGVIRGGRASDIIHSDELFIQNLPGSNGGELILSGANTYAGGTMLLSGTLGVGNSQALGSGPLSMADGTTLQFVGGGFNIANAIVFTGKADPTIDTGANTDTLSGVISGAGGLTKIGTGTLILAATNTYTGPTTIASGTLDVTGSIAGSAVTVESGAALAGSGSVGGLTVQSGGVIAPGAVTPFSTLNVSGNVTFAAGSIYLFGINPAGQSDTILATGKATLSGGTVQVIAAPGSYNPSLRYTILTANGGVTGTFAQLTANLAFAFLTPGLSYDANDVFLGFTQTLTPAGTPVPFPSVAVTRNEASTAAAVQALGLGNPIFNAVLTQSAPGARQAFDAFSGEIHANAVTAAFEDQHLPREAIFDRLSQPAEAPVLGAVTTMTGAYAADLPSGKGPALAPVAVQMVQPRLFGLWGQGFGDWGKTDNDHNAGKLSRDTGGFIIGADAERQFLNDDWRIGVAAGYTDDSLKVQARSSSGDYQSIFGALYGKASYGAIDLKAGAILASSNTHTSRSIIFPVFADAASASYGGTAAQGFGELGYRLPFRVTLWSFVPGLSSLTASYEPFLQGALIHIDQNRYIETALNGAALVGVARGYDLGTTTLGLRTQYQLASLPGFTWTSLIGWRHAFGDVIPKVNQTFVGSFSSFTIAGVPIDRDAFVS